MTKEELEKEAEDNKPPYAFYAIDTNCEIWKDGYKKGAEPREKRIAELEETCNKWFEHLKNREEELLNELNNQNAKYNKQIEDLEKENAELKADNDARKFAMAMSGKVEKQLREENKKAEEIIKGLLSFVDSLGNYSGGIFAKAEQFINSEVKK